MFTGIVDTMGTVAEIARGPELTRLTISAADAADGLRVGDSVSVNGVCLTAVEVGAADFSVEAIPETLARTNLGDLDVGGRVNLERPVPVNGRFDGHIVQGHVDGVGTVAERERDGDSVRVRYAVDPGLTRYIVEKGSIAIDGTSLTVTATSAVDAASPWFEVALIPHTLAVTVLGDHRVGDRVNLEVDILAKYIERMLGGRGDA